MSVAEGLKQVGKDAAAGVAHIGKSLEGTWVEVLILLISWPLLVVMGAISGICKSLRGHM